MNEIAAPHLRDRTHDALARIFDTRLSSCGVQRRCRIERRCVAVRPVGAGNVESLQRRAAAGRRQRSFAIASGYLYVANTATNSITVYRQNATGNTAPLRVIEGANTKIDTPGQLSQDGDGNLYVANGRFGATSAHPAVLVFARGAHGNATPDRILAGAKTGLHNIQGMTVDRITGELFVIDSADNVEASLLRFAANATGDEAPLARSAPGPLTTFQIASDSTGHNILQAHPPTCCSGVYAGVDTIAKHFANNAQLAFLYSINFISVTSVVDDPLTHTYLTALNGGGIARFAEDTDGSPGNPPQPPTFKPAMVSLITSNTCGSQLALDFQRNIYVTYSTASTFYAPCSSDAVYVYAHDASGNAAPLQILTGPATKLAQPWGIYEGL